MKRPDPPCQLDPFNNDESGQDDCPPRNPGLIRPRQGSEGCPGTPQVEEKQDASDNNERSSKDHTCPGDEFSFRKNQMKGGSNRSSPSSNSSKKKVSDHLPPKDKTPS